MKKFTLLELFPIVDGRIANSHSWTHVYDILCHVTGKNLLSDELPIAKQYIATVIIPMWFEYAKADLLEMEVIDFGTSFEAFIDRVKSCDLQYEIPELTSDQKKEFEKYLIENGLIKTQE